MLPEQRAAAAGHGHRLPAHDEAARQVEARAGHAVHELQQRRRLERREREQQQERGHELRPDEEGQPHEREPRRAQLHDRRDEVDRAEERRRDEEDHADEPERLARGGDVGERRVGRPARARGAARREEARDHHHAARRVGPVARQVQPRERHVRRADLQRHQVVAEAAHGERHHPQEDHDGAVHRAELVVELGQHDAARRARVAEQAADERDGLARVGELPAHQHHQEEADQQEHHRRDGVLDADDLVVGREEVAPPEGKRTRAGRARLVAQYRGLESVGTPIIHYRTGSGGSGVWGSRVLGFGGSRLLRFPAEEPENP